MVRLHARLFCRHGALRGAIIDREIDDDDNDNDDDASSGGDASELARDTSLSRECFDVATVVIQVHEVGMLCVAALTHVLSQSLGDATSVGIDRVALGACVRVVRTAIAQLSSSVASKGSVSATKRARRSIDIYNDAMPDEIALACEPTRDVLARAHTLLLEHPLSDSLLRVANVCVRLLALPLSAPLLRAATGVETLLSAMRDWDAFAPKHLSLTELAARLTALVTRWRRLEIDSWSTLLERRQAQFDARARRFWFALHAMLLAHRDAHGSTPPWYAAARVDDDDDFNDADDTAALARTDDGEIETALDIDAAMSEAAAKAAVSDRARARALFDDFIRTCERMCVCVCVRACDDVSHWCAASLGEFRTRLDLLYAFHCQVDGSITHERV
jgi:hypothetical protein